MFTNCGGREDDRNGEIAVLPHLGLTVDLCRQAGDELHAERGARFKVQRLFRYGAVVHHLETQEARPVRGMMEADHHLAASPRRKAVFEGVSVAWLRASGAYGLNILK